MKILEDAARRSIAYREGAEHRAVSPDAAAVARLREFVEVTPEDGTADSAIMSQLDELASPASIAMSGPRFFGFVIGGSMPVTLAANWLAGAWDQNAVMHSVTPAVSTIEKVAVDWMIDMLRLPKESGAALVTGATVANFTALAAARGKVLGDQGWDVRADGLFGAPEIAVVVGAEAHPTLLKALSMLGLGERRVHTVPVDDQGRMRADKIPDLPAPAIYCAQVGNINSGAFDPVDAICDLAKSNGGWVHVDGAFGLWAAVSPRFDQWYEGVPRADSWATDAHKWLNVPYDCGVAFVRDVAALRGAMAISADYLVAETVNRSPSDYTPELSRRARGVEVWAALKSLGRNGVRELIERCCRHARRFASELAAAGFEVLNDVVLNQVLVSFGSAQDTLAIVAEIQKDGTCWCGSTVWQGRTAMRISVSNWSTTDADVDESVHAIVRIARQQKC